MEDIKKDHSDFGWLSQGFDHEHLVLNEQAVRKCFMNLLPDTNLYLVRGNICVHPEFGNVIAPEYEPSVMLHLSAYRFRDEADFVGRMRNVKNIYLNGCYSVPGQTEFIMGCYTPGKKKNATFTIDDNVLSSFSQLCDKMAINKSKFLENYMKEFVQKNS